MTRASLKQFLAALPRTPSGESPLNPAQEQAVRHDGSSPLWIIAGPGTGKTHTLAWLTLKRLLVDGESPERVVVTTFTRKAATELRVRLAQNLEVLRGTGLEGAQHLDLARLQLGTLHSLCASLLQRFRYPPTFRMRSLDGEVAQRFFVQRSENPLLACLDANFWGSFAMTRDARERGERGETKPAPHCVRLPENVAARAGEACRLFNYLSENLVASERLRLGGAPLERGHFVRLAEAYEHYCAALQQAHFTDSALFQRHFLDFVRSADGTAWLEGGLSVIVDEYQDTNPVQEAIYFALAGARGDLTVVGDDDQSLYRFRNATVEALTAFDGRCEQAWQGGPTRVDLHENHRSHAEIVSFVNQFVRRSAALDGLRTANKPSLVAKADLSGAYPAVQYILEEDCGRASLKVARCVTELLGAGRVSDPSQIAMLAYSVRTGEQGHRSVGPYVDALRAAKVPVHNPRGGNVPLEPAVLELLGALSYLIDAHFEVRSWQALPHELREYVKKARSACASLLAADEARELRAYLRASLDYLRTLPDGRLVREDGSPVTLLSALSKLLSFDPFAGRVFDERCGEHVRALHAMLAQYCQHFDDGALLRGTGGVSLDCLQKFYGVFVANLYAKLQEGDDDEHSLRPGCVNMLTVHQAKGMEFEVVFCLNPDYQIGGSSTYLIEERLGKLGARGAKRLRPKRARMDEDAARQLFVAYSRAKRLLFVVGRSETEDRALRGWKLALQHVAPRGISTAADLDALGLVRL